MTAWVIRAGRYGERDAWALEGGWSGGGWSEVPDLTAHTTREAVGAVVAETFSTDGEAKVANYTGQLWALRGRIEPGDLLAMPLKTTRQIALGRVTSGYRYLSTSEDTACRHVVGVDWIRTDLPRTAVKQDLLYTLGSALSIFAPAKNEAVARLERLLESGHDPGQVPFLPAPTAGSPLKSSQDADQAGMDDPELQPNIDEVATDRISARIHEEFSGHRLADLVAEILTAEGFTCTVSPPGIDRGIDIVAGRGVLGIDPPRLIVQVKSGGAVGSPVVNQLHGVVNGNNADQGLLVAWDGVTSPAREALRGLQFKVSLWTSTEVVDAVLRTYDRLSDDTRAQLPLKRVWVLAD